LDSLKKVEKFIDEYSALETVTLEGIEFKYPKKCPYNPILEMKKSVMHCKTGWNFTEEEILKNYKVQ
jgi:hypothetical protein